MQEILEDVKQSIEARTKDEEYDAIESVIPPVDIIAFNEQRSCADIYRMYSQGQIEINPDFQRGEVWQPKAQTLFIDSLIKQLPIPSLCISIDASSQKRIVIDGLQRITSIVKFLNPDTTWRLTRTDDVDKRISGKTPQEIKKENKGLYDILENVTIPITVIRCDYSKQNHMEYLFQIFHRLNSGGCKLLNQEIRNCIYNGPFNTFLKKAAKFPEWLIFTNSDEGKVDSSRFDHEERILRFFAFAEKYVEYKGRLASFLNNYMNNNKNASPERIVGYTENLLSTLSIANKITAKPESKNLAEAVLVGIYHNRGKLKDKSELEINQLYNDLLLNSAFSSENLKEGLGSTDKIKNRIETSIEVFSRG